MDVTPLVSRVTQTARRIMLARKRGNIVNVSSKFTGPDFTRRLANLYSRDGICANCIVPQRVFNAHLQNLQDNVARLSPLAHMCHPAELRELFVIPWARTHRAT